MNCGSGSLARNFYDFHREVPKAGRIIPQAFASLPHILFSRTAIKNKTSTSSFMQTIFSRNIIVSQDRGSREMTLSRRNKLSYCGTWSGRSECGRTESLIRRSLRSHEYSSSPLKSQCKSQCISVKCHGNLSAPHRNHSEIWVHLSES